MQLQPSLNTNVLGTTTMAGCVSARIAAWRGAALAAGNRCSCVPAISCAPRYPGAVMPCFGVHPIRSGAEGRSVLLQDLESALPLFDKYKDKLVAIGEVGLDFTPWLVPTPQQREEQQRVLALNLSNSPDPSVLSSLPLFCTCVVGVQAGYYFSFPPAVTRHDQQAKLIKQIPLENICLESDSPSLGPNKEVQSKICRLVPIFKLL
uniref:Uncharacterized protein n=1 Tax=Dromaius novaehollandiae TaxID=8790 RepID=A0A8C4J5R3_DRONO